MRAATLALALVALAAPLAAGEAPTGAAALWGNKYQGDVSCLRRAEGMRKQSVARAEPAHGLAADAENGASHRRPPPAGTANGSCGRAEAGVEGDEGGRASGRAARHPRGARADGRAQRKKKKKRPPFSRRPPLNHSPFLSTHHHTKQGTYYGDWGGQGACSFQFSNTVKEPWADGVALRVAMNSRQWSGSEVCGMCLRFKGFNKGAGGEREGGL